jgi:hypothetical protein
LDAHERMVGHQRDQDAALQQQQAGTQAAFAHRLVIAQQQAIEQEHATHHALLASSHVSQSGMVRTSVCCLESP